MSDSLATKQWQVTCRPTYRKSNSFKSMTKTKKNNESGSSQSSTSLNYLDQSNENNSTNTSLDFNTNGITTSSTPFGTKAASFSGYPHGELMRMSNDGLEKSWSGKINSSKKKQEHKTPKITSSSQKISDFFANYKIILIALLFIVIATIPLCTYSAEKNYINIKELKEKFPNQPNETWLYFEAIIDDILFINPTHPAVFLLLYTKENNQVNDLIHHLAKYASTKLETNQDYIYVDQKEFHSKEAIKDYGYLISKYENDLIRKKVMVVEDLQDIPGKVAQAFHTFCDEITPLVEKVVYIFTLKVDSLNGKEENIAEKYLKRFWNDLDNDILMPLITRVTSTVLKIVN